MFETPIGATPLTDEDLTGLIPTYLSTRADLNQVEADNIAKARTRFLLQQNKYRNLEILLDDITVRAIHREKYGDVWKWAGTYRNHMTNIGIMPEQIPIKTRELLLNTQESLRYCDRNDQIVCDVLALRFHWKLVSIHPFPNGNGRHARMMADLLVQSLGYPSFEWGPEDMVNIGEVRFSYIAALRRADETNGEMEDLFRFARRKS
jgi:Fic-DOC domain mobile mystery protein B